MPDPPLSMRAYLDLFGNRVTRVEVPAGTVTFSNRFVIRDSGRPDGTPPDVRTTPIDDLPDDVLLFLVSSRYCDGDKLADFAWSRFGKLSGGTRVVQAICDFVHAKIRFNYMDEAPVGERSNHSLSNSRAIARPMESQATKKRRLLNRSVPIGTDTATPNSFPGKQ